MDDGAAPTGPRETTAFLLAQLGAHSARLFARRVGELGLTPAQVGLVRRVAAMPGRTQRALAAEVGLPAARLVPLVDDLEQRGVLVRHRNPADRREIALHLGTAGEDLLAGALAAASDEHDDALTSGLGADDRRVLNDLLTRVAATQRLTPGLHPGFRGLGAPPVS